MFLDSKPRKIARRASLRQQRPLFNVGHLLIVGIAAVLVFMMFQGQTVLVRQAEALLLWFRLNALFLGVFLVGLFALSGCMRLQGSARVVAGVITLVCLVIVAHGVHAF